MSGGGGRNPNLISFLHRIDSMVDKFLWFEMPEDQCMIDERGFWCRILIAHNLLLCPNFEESYPELASSHSSSNPKLTNL